MSSRELTIFCRGRVEHNEMVKENAKKFVLDKSGWKERTLLIAPTDERWLVLCTKQIRFSLFHIYATSCVAWRLFLTRHKKTITSQLSFDSMWRIRTVNQTSLSGLVSRHGQLPSDFSVHSSNLWTIKWECAHCFIRYYRKFNGSIKMYSFACEESYLHLQVRFRSVRTAEVLKSVCLFFAYLRAFVVRHAC